MNIDKSVLCCDDVFRVSRFCLSRTTTTTNNNYSMYEEEEEKKMGDEKSKNNKKKRIGKKEWFIILKRKGEWIKFLRFVDTPWRHNEN